MKGEKCKVRIYSDAESRQLDVYEVPQKILSYNFDNVRISGEKAKIEYDRGKKLNPTDPADQRTVQNILYSSKFYSKTATEDLQDDIKGKGQDEPAIVTVDGVVWNGNRRLAIRRQLLKDTGDQKYSRVGIVVLPELSGKELKILERRLQMHRDWKEDYGSIQTRLDVRNSLNDSSWTDQETIASYGGRYTIKELKNYKNEIDLIDDYLKRIGKPSDYASIQDVDRKGVESFVTLNSIVKKERSKKTKDLEIEKIKLTGFRLIKHKKSTYHTLRDFESVLSHQQARNEFESNSPTFRNFPKRTYQFDDDAIEKEFDNVDVATETVRSSRKDAKKLAEDALKTLQRITNDRIPKNNANFKDTLRQLADEINKLKSYAG